MSDMKQYNEEQYLMLKLAIANMSSGICLFRSYDAKEQVKIAEKLKKDVPKECCILDMSQITAAETPDDIIKLRKLLEGNENTKVVVFCNLQICGVRLGDKEYIQRLNYMRDQMFDMEKIWVLGMTPYFATLLSQQARDLYSCILNHFEFKQTDKERLWIFEENDFFGDVKINLLKFTDLQKQIQMQGIEKTSTAILLRTINVWTGILEYCTKETIEWVKEVLTFLKNYIFQGNLKKGEYIKYLPVVTAYRQLYLSDEALQVALKIKEESEKVFINENRDMINIYKQLGSIYCLRKEYDIAEENMNKVAWYYKEVAHECTYDYLVSMDTIAQIKGMRGERQEAVKIYQSLIAEVEEKYSKDYKYLSVLWNNMGAAYAVENQFSNALKCFFKSDELMQLINDENIRKKANTDKNIGYMYAKIGDYDQAIVYLEKAELLLKKIDPSLVALDKLEFIYKLMSDCYKNKHNTEMSKRYKNKQAYVRYRKNRIK